MKIEWVFFLGCVHCRYHLKDAVLDGGIPFNKAYGMTTFEYHGTDPRFNKVFNNGMLGHSSITMKNILEAYKGFEGLHLVVDVGDGTGATINMIISKYPTIKGINFDLPHVIEDAPSYPGKNIHIIFFLILKTCFSFKIVNCSYSDMSLVLCFLILLRQ